MAAPHLHSEQGDDSEHSVNPPANYVPSATLEAHRTLAEVGGCVSSGVGGILYCKKVPVKYRHPDIASDVNKYITVKISSECSSKSRPSSSREHARGSGLWSRLDGSLNAGVLLESLHVELSDDRDPFTLLRLNLTINGFQQLREEQRLLVDFDTFPGMFIQLLESCWGTPDQTPDSTPDPTPARALARSDENVFPQSRRMSADSESQKLSARHLSQEDLGHRQNFLGQNSLDGNRPSSNYIARSSLSKSSQLPPDSSSMSLEALLVCNCDGSCPTPGALSFSKGPQDQTIREDSPTRRPVQSATLYLIETNHFKELTHLTLRFDAADDLATKNYLSIRVNQFRIYSTALEAEMQLLKTHHQRWMIHYESTKKHLDKISEDLSSIKDKMNQEHKDEIQQLIDSNEIKLQNQKNSLCEGRANLESKLRREIESLTNERNETDEKYQAIATTKSALERNEKSLRGELTETRESFLSKSAELEQLRTQLREANSSKENFEVENRSLRERVAADQQELIELRACQQQQKESNEKLNSGKKREKELKEALEKSGAEITKGNELLQKLQLALRKERAKTKQSQSSNANELQASTSLKTRVSDLEASETELSKSKIELEKQLDLTSRELKDCRHTINGQRTLIATLESQLTERTVESVLLSSSSSRPLLASSPAMLESGRHCLMNAVPSPRQTILQSQAGRMSHSTPPTEPPTAHNGTLTRSFRKLSEATHAVPPTPMSLKSWGAPLPAEMSFGRPRAAAQTSEQAARAEETEEECSLNVSTSTLESSGAPHFGTRRSQDAAATKKKTERRKKLRGAT